MMEIATSFEREADDEVDGILAESSISPSLIPFLSLDPALEPFRAFDDGAPSLARMKRCAMHHDEAFEL